MYSSDVLGKGPFFWAHTENRICKGWSRGQFTPWQSGLHTFRIKTLIKRAPPPKVTGAVVEDQCYYMAKQRFSQCTGKATVWIQALIWHDVCKWRGFLAINGGGGYIYPKIFSSFGNKGLVRMQTKLSITTEKLVHPGFIYSTLVLLMDNNKAIFAE